MPTKDEMRALLNLAAPAEEEPFDLVVLSVGMAVDADGSGVPDYQEARVGSGIIEGGGLSCAASGRRGDSSGLAWGGVAFGVRCGAAFAMRNISVVQTLHTRANNISF